MIATTTMTPAAPPSPAMIAADRTLLFLGCPALWPAWPFLPVVRRRAGAQEELRVVVDFRGTTGRPGLSAAALLTNLFLAPADEAGLLALPREVYDSAAELTAAGWAVD